MARDPASIQPPAAAANSAPAPATPPSASAPDQAAGPATAGGSASAPLPASPPTPPPSLGRQARTIAALVTLLGLGVLVWPRGGDSTTAAPAGFLLDAGGRAATLGSHLAPVTLVHFWATWCPPCIEETPVLDRLVRDFAGNRDFAVLRVAVADSSSRVEAFLGSGAPGVLYDPQWETAHRYGTDQLPETYLVVGGRIVEKFIGEVNWDDPAVRQKIAARLPRGPSGGGSGMTGSS
jgi:cytochrome c biogenesis protein CcmG/thiol:disulfide interchange protein DsbE